MLKIFPRIILLLAIVLGYSFHSQAALLIEPVVGYSFGKSNLDIEVPATPAANETSDNSLKGASYGGRLGYQNFGLQIGVDYLASSMVTDGDDLSTSEFGGFIGYEFPVLLRVYAGYVFSGTATLEDDDADFDFEKGVGPKIGIGLTLLPFLDFNIEYRSIKYAELEQTVEGADVVLNADYNAIMVGFSLPFTL